jgi:L-arabinokinase
LLRAAEHAAQAYATAGLLLRLPFAGDLSAFPRIEDVPLVARRPALPKDDARRRLSLDERQAVLLSFGGIGMPELDPSALGGLDEYLFLLTGRMGSGDAPNVRRLDAGALAAAGLGYTDLVGAVDVVVSKPGYGIVTDCIGAGTRFVYTDRGDFPEYPTLVAGMKDCLPVRHVSNDELRAGRLEEVLRDVCAIAFPPPPRTDGAEVAADRLLSTL